VATWALVSAAWWTEDAANEHIVFRDEGAFGFETYAGGADKLGHFYANYALLRVDASLLEWGGFSRKTSVALASLFTTALFTAIEIKDGYQQNYGFSWGDVAANLSGEATAVAFQLLPELDAALSLKLAYFPSRDYLASSGKEALNVAEDYSGQTYLVAFHFAALGELTRSSAGRPLRYLDVFFGYGTRGFKPAPAAPEPVRQLVSAGFSLNLQRVFDDLLPRGTAVAAIVHFGNELLQLPYTWVPVVTYERRGPPKTPD
jgi:hypothetical protein